MLGLLIRDDFLQQLSGSIYLFFFKEQLERKDALPHFFFLLSEKVKITFLGHGLDVLI